MLNTEYNGIKYGFYDDHMTINSVTLYYADMDNIAHRGGDVPAFLFDFKGKRYTLPYRSEEKETILPYFQLAAGTHHSSPPIEPIEPVYTADAEPQYASTVSYPQPEPAVPDPQPAPAMPNPQPAPAMQAPQTIHVVQEKYTGFWSIGRLVLGIIAMLLAFFIIFQSCAAGIVNAIDETGDASGSMGVFLALFMIVGGIVGIASRNGKRKVGPLITAILFFLGFLIGLSGIGSTYTDLPIWGGVSACIGIVYLICAIKTKKPTK